MADMKDVTAAIDDLVVSVKKEIDRVAENLTNSIPDGNNEIEEVDEAEIQSAVDRLKNLSAQLDAVRPDAVASGTAAVISTQPDGEASPGQLGSSPTE